MVRLWLLENSIIDKLNNAGFDVSRTKNDYRLSAIGAGVSWRPSGVETENAIWVTVDGDDSNSLLQIAVTEKRTKKEIDLLISTLKEID